MKNTTRTQISNKLELAKIIKRQWEIQYNPDGRRLTLPELCKMLAPENWEEMLDLVRKT
jgi:hypothetical protein